MAADGRDGNFIFYSVCTLADGTVISPASSTTPAATSPFSGKGFPGLPAVDLTGLTTVPLQDGPSTGTVTTDGKILGYTFESTATSAINFSFKRLSGNLNLELIVLSPDNKVVFQSSLVTSDTLSTHFSLPANGVYTLAVFRIDLLPPDHPQATTFQVQAQG